MATNPALKRYLDAGMDFTSDAQARAEALVRDLVKSGEVQAEQAQSAVNELVERSRKNTEKFLETIRSEVRDQVKSLGLATQDDIARLEKKISAVGGAKKAPAKKAAAKKAPAKKATAKKSAAKKSAAKKTAAKKA